MTPADGSLVDQPHHDGSERYVAPQQVGLGERVTVRLRVPDGFAAAAVHVRVVEDGEPRIVAATPEPDEGVTWWTAELTVHNPVLRYRFLVEGGTGGFAWVNGTGVHTRDVTDAADFRIGAFPAAPDWAREAVVYQIFPDRFARSAAADERPVPDWAIPKGWDDPIELDPRTIARQFYGGDLDGIIEHLDHIVELGATVVYLTPFFPGRTNHRYDATTFDHVDPLLGGDDALTRLVEACHARGLKVMGDITTNHTGSAHEWFLRAHDDPDAPERAYYYFEDSELGYVGGKDHRHLPKLNYASAGLRNRMLVDPEGAIQKWLRPPYSMDGWRVDVANMTGRFGAYDRYHEIAREVRAAVASVGDDRYLVAEHCHDLYGELDGDGWHGVMNYAGFTRPAWTWLRDPNNPPTFLGQPIRLPRLRGADVVATMRDFNAEIPWQGQAASFDLLGSHDTTRVATLVGGDPDVVAAAVALMFTMPGVPMVCYGDEAGLEGLFGEDGRRTMPWARPDAWPAGVAGSYRALAHLRRAHRALTHGGLRWLLVDDDVLVYAREASGEAALVAVSRAAHGPIHLPLSALPGVAAGELVHGEGLTVDETGIHYERAVAGAAVWTTGQP